MPELKENNVSTLAAAVHAQAGRIAELVTIAEKSLQGILKPQEATPAAGARLKSEAIAPLAEGIRATFDMQNQTIGQLQNLLDRLAL